MNKTEKQGLLELKENVALITINRPPANALNNETLYELQAVFRQLELNPNVGAIVLTGSGEKNFSSGADISEFGEMADRGTADVTLNRMHDFFNYIERFPKPVIACINGKALGGGNELQMACHLSIASDTAELGQPEIRLGIMPGYGGTQRLPRQIGQRRALELLLTGDRISAQKAADLGLINRIVPQERLLDEALKWAKQLADGPPLAMKGILDAVYRGSEVQLDEGMEIERNNVKRVMTSEDAVEGVMAFFTKRGPKFKGR
ncbi:enoyl-CoA hydratase/isomerase family protein [Fictibacillus terranigra]|uniref:Enoyl-CoA hydratase-related protein n=1 Tax=Fictibacillus terranigra TaxID=3058424 RepID=A0ABT8E944_9BACL|nr:enoyl-CoA hydratase-related protein [Fictibacillus sp. CENA-BCM004]MDN4074438.1 enoyl-CoA hydratase-related protein [Fictibacillus sp. CENA-BCM004]